MRKTLIAVAVIAAGAAVFYKFGMKSESALGVLEYVPADTVLFSGQLEPIDLATYIKASGFSMTQTQQVFEELKTKLASAETPEAKFAAHVINANVEAMKTPESVASHFGLKAQTRSLVYMVGVAPVMKMEVADEAAFFKVLDDAEKASGFSHTAQQLNELKYRQYHFVLEGIEFDLLVSVNAGWGTYAVTSSKLAPEHLAIILGAQKPEQSLASTNYIDTIAKKYQLNQGMIGFFSFEQLAKVLTSKDGNRLAKDLNTLFGAEMDANPDLAVWRTPACATDVAAIAKSWPGVYFDGSYAVAATDITMNSKVVIPTENKDTVAALSAMRGFIPTAVSSNTSAMMHWGVGFDVGQLASSAGKLWNTFTQTKYTCEPLVKMQEGATANNPLAALAMTGMANGVQGLSVTLNSFEMDTATGQPKSLDALVTVSATNARAVIESLKAMVPDLASIPLPKDGEAQDLSAMLPPGAMPDLKPMLQLNNSHVAISVGDKGKTQADAVMKEATSKNGLMSMGIDYKAFFGSVLAAMPVDSPEQQKEFEQLQKIDMKLNMTMDVNDSGLVFSSQIQMPKK